MLSRPSFQGLPSCGDLLTSLPSYTEHHSHKP
jgi:hypothetical protein